ncbi:MAG: hypothetical protein HY318_15570 [Armatimonadetes bacterium]|nr:hypothetical protein [Armatimonadota bacterium]
MPKDEAPLGEQIELHTDHVREGRTDADILSGPLLRSGFPLTTPVETLPLTPALTSAEEREKIVYFVADGALLICLDRELTLHLIRVMSERFAGNDQLKANTVEIVKTKGVHVELLDGRTSNG